MLDLVLICLLGGLFFVGTCLGWVCMVVLFSLKFVSLYVCVCRFYVTVTLAPRWVVFYRCFPFA